MIERILKISIDELLKMDKTEIEELLKKSGFDLTSMVLDDYDAITDCVMFKQREAKEKKITLTAEEKAKIELVYQFIKQCVSVEKSTLFAQKGFDLSKTIKYSYDMNTQTHIYTQD